MRLSVFSRQTVTRTQPCWTVRSGNRRTDHGGGTISFFGTRRVVVLPEVDPGAYGAKDLDELCSTLASLENAVVVLGSVFPLERSKLKAGKSAQKLIAQCKAIGYVEELAKPRPFELKA